LSLGGEKKKSKHLEQSRAIQFVKESRVRLRKFLGGPADEHRRT
jgi:hypothetical protein